MPTFFVTLFLKVVAILFYPNVTAICTAISVASIILTAPEDPAIDPHCTPSYNSTRSSLVLYLIIPNKPVAGLSTVDPTGITNPPASDTSIYPVPVVFNLIGADIVLVIVFPWNLKSSILS